MKLTGDFFKKIIVTKTNMKPWTDDDGIMYVGLYDFLLSDQADAAGYGNLFFVYVIVLDIIAWILIKHEFRTDRPL